MLPVYTLSSSLSLGDLSPIRSLLSHTTNLLAGSGSPILTIDTTPVTSVPFSGAVTALCAVNGTKVAAGCADAIIYVIDKTTFDYTRLTGHGKNVTSLCLLGQNKIISGSWDGTAKVWDVETGECLQTLEGHDNGVCVGYDAGSDTIYTGASGRAEGGGIVGCDLRVWRKSTTEGATAEGKYECVNVTSPHTGPIRGIAVTTLGVVTCSNDADVCVCDLSSGAVIQRIGCDDASNPFLLCCAVVECEGRLGDCEEGGSCYKHVVTGAENGQAFVSCLSDGSVRQTIPHPGTVWCVAGLGNGDLVTGCHDGKVRVFTRDVARVAPEEVVREYEGECEKFSSSMKNGPSKAEIDKLDLWEDHHGIRKEEGTVQVFNKQGTAIAARYESGNWIEVGEVTGYGGGEELNGVKYDHVLDIEIERAGSVQTLKIGYNDGENHFVAAQKFIDDHELQQGYLGQIADYIKERCGTKKANNTIDMTAGEANVEMQDAALPDPPAATYEFLPNRSMQVFINGEDKVDKITSKIFEIYTALGPADTEAIVEVGGVIKQSNRYHATTVTQQQMGALKRLVTENGSVDCFPAVDLLRLASCHPSVCEREYLGYWVGVVDSVVGAMEKDLAAVAVNMLGFRLVCNLLKPVAFVESSVLWSGERVAKISQLAGKVFEGNANKNVRSSALAVLGNLAVLSANKNNALDAHSAFELSASLVAAATTAESRDDSDAARKCLVALGTVAVSGFKAQVASAGIEAGLANKLREMSNCKEVLGEVERAVGGL